MRALLLAAGRGSRLNELTADQPKCLTIVRGKTLLEWQLSALYRAGVTEVAAVVGYRAEKLARFPLTVFENPHWESTNSAVSLKCADAWLKSGPCLVSYTDILYGQETVKQVMTCPGELVVPNNTDWKRVWDLRFDDPLQDAETFEFDPVTREILDIGGKPLALSEIQGQFMGLLKIEPSAWTKLLTCINAHSKDDLNKLDITTLLRRIIESGFRPLTTNIAGGWFEIDTQKDLKALEKYPLTV